VTNLLSTKKAFSYTRKYIPEPDDRMTFISNDGRDISRQGLRAVAPRISAGNLTERLLPERLGDCSRYAMQHIGIPAPSCLIPAKFMQVQGLGREERGEAMRCH
jgi:hypothetical protein